MNITNISKIILLYFILISIWWFVLFFVGIRYNFHNYLYQLGFGLIPLFGGVAGIFKSNKWGFLSSKVGSGVFYISLGLLSWGLGQMAWSYYNLVANIEVPYPSWADAGYIGAVPLWIIGIIYLSQATGAKFSLKKINGKIALFLIPLLAALLSYYLLIVVARDGTIDFSSDLLKLFFDLAYPIGDLVILTLALLVYGLSFKYLGGRFKIPVITIIVGFICMYVTDFSFSYVTTTGTYYNGHWVDLLFPMVMTILACGINNLDPGLEK